MKPFITSAALLAALWFSPGVSSAQEPERAPAPAPERSRRETAMPRSDAPRPPAENQGARERSEPAAREPQAAPAAVRRENAAAEEQSRRRAPVADTTSTSAASEDQGAQRRGATRRPPSSRGADGNGGQSARDRAVPRTSAPRDRDGDRGRIYVYPDYWSYGRYYDPYYDGGLHLGYLAYSPWGWTPAFYGYPYGYGGGHGYGYRASGFETGSVKIKVKPRDAQVYVDGYYAGEVDDFDGFLQSLQLDLGGHRIEVRKDGFETLQFDVHVQPDRTITFRGEMEATP